MRDALVRRDRIDETAAPGVNSSSGDLAPNRLFNTLVLSLGLSDEPIRLLFTETAVFIGLLQLA